jgi:hypothetical protein
MTVSRSKKAKSRRKSKRIPKSLGQLGGSVGRTITIGQYTNQETFLKSFLSGTATLFQWLDAADPNGTNTVDLITQPGSVALTDNMAWTDKSGNSRTMTRNQGTPRFTPNVSTSLRTGQADTSPPFGKPAFDFTKPDGARLMSAPYPKADNCTVFVMGLMPSTMGYTASSATTCTTSGYSNGTIWGHFGLPEGQHDAWCLHLRRQSNTYEISVRTSANDYFRTRGRYGTSAGDVHPSVLANASGRLFPSSTSTCVTNPPGVNIDPFTNKPIPLVPFIFVASVGNPGLGLTTADLTTYLWTGNLSNTVVSSSPQPPSASPPVGPETIRYTGAISTSSYPLTGNSNSGGIFIGASESNNEYGINYVCESIYYHNTSFTDSDIQAIAGYLAWKWGMEKCLTGTYAAGSPFMTPTASAALASSRQASSAVASAAQAAAAQASSSLASAQQAVAAQVSAALASSRQASSAVASAGQAVAAQASSALASRQQAVAAQVSAAEAASKQASSAVASAGQAVAAQASSALASAQQAFAVQASAAEASSKQASSALASAAAASMAAASSAEISAAQVSSAQGSAARASAGQAAIIQASAAEASLKQASSAIASAGQAAAAQASSAVASSAVAAASIASAAAAYMEQNSAAIASSQQAAAAQLSSARESSAQAALSQASAANVSGQQASAAQASSAQVSSAQASLAQASTAVASSAQASSALASSAVAAASIASAAAAYMEQNSAAIASSQQASAAQFSSARESSAQAAVAQASAANVSGQQASNAQASSAQTSSAQAAAAQASAAAASFAQASTARASSAQAATAQASAATASAEQASAAVASTAQANKVMGIDPTNGRYIFPSSDLDQTIEINDYSCQYIRIRPSISQGDGFIHFSQIMIYDIGGTLISPSALIFASSTLSTVKKPQILLDGTTTPRTIPNIWHSASNNRNTEYVEINLMVPQTVSAIRIIGRSDCPPNYVNCKQRMFFLRVELNSTTTADATAYYNTQAAAIAEAAAQASAAKVSAAQAALIIQRNAEELSMATASSAKASAEQAAAAEASAAVAHAKEVSAAVASNAQQLSAQVSAGQASAARASAAFVMTVEGQKASAAQAAAAQASSSLASAAMTSSSLASSAMASAAQQFSAEASAAQASSARASMAQGIIALGLDPPNGKYILTSMKNDQSILARKSARYIRVRPALYQGDGYIQICQIAVMNLLGKNLALNAPVYASSSQDQGPSCVVDGVLKARVLCWQNATPNTDDFIEIDLGDKRDIALIRIIAPPTSDPRMIQMRVEANLTTTQDVLDYYAAAKAAIQASAAGASVAQASAAQASSAGASLAQASAAQALLDSSATASTAQASAASASSAQAFLAQENILLGNDPKRGKYILPTNDADQTISTNEYEGRYIRIRPSVQNGDGWLNISQVIVNDVTLSNIAAGKLVYATSNYPQIESPSIVVDDSRAVRDFPNLWQSGTNDRNKEFLEIDLGDMNFISSIQILGRGNCRNAQYCIDRMMGVRIEINKHTNPNVLNAYASGALARIPVDPDNNPPIGRFLIR